MRISTANRYSAAVESLQVRQADMVVAQTQMTSGKRINKPSDDPTGAARAERAYVAQQRIGSDQRSVDASRNVMTLTESALGQAGDLMQSARETLVAAGNGSLGASGRAIQADQLIQLRAQLLTLANQAGSAGGYLFGGQGATVMPFLDKPYTPDTPETPGGVTWSATGGQNQLSASEQMPTTVDGQAIWLSAPSGNGVFVTGGGAANKGTAWIDVGTVTTPGDVTDPNYEIAFAGSGDAATYSVTPDDAAGAQSNVAFKSGRTITVGGMSVHITGAPADGDVFTLKPSTPDLSPFAALDRAIDMLRRDRDPPANAGQIAQAVNSGLRDLDAVMGHFQAARADVGSTLNRLDAIDGRNQDRLLWAKAVQADAEDVDMVQAISDFKNQQTGYQAALQSYAAVQRMSLFDYIK